MSMTGGPHRSRCLRSRSQAAAFQFPRERDCGDVGQVEDFALSQGFAYCVRKFPVEARFLVCASSKPIVDRVLAQATIGGGGFDVVIRPQQNTDFLDEFGGEFGFASVVRGDGN